ncbi:hypothetical protein ACIBG5_37205 [Kribbella sp. NPDC050241]|uniref:hypothetical protein n=1 Tax=Kribbella sp. NPDC050241 TaxID=3364115 RepID=UPI0037A8E00C
MTLTLCLRHVPIPVDPTNDWVDFLGAFSGVIGALLAAAAIWYAFRQSAAAKRDLIRERRLEFELGLLAQLRHQMSITRFGHISGYVGALVRDSANETDLPLIRAVVGIKAGPKGAAIKADIVGDEPAIASEVQERLLARGYKEVDEAIQRRLDGDKA